MDKAFRCTNTSVDLKSTLVYPNISLVIQWLLLKQKMRILRCVIPVVCVTNEREVNVVKTTQLIRKDFIF